MDVLRRRGHDADVAGRHQVQGIARVEEPEVVAQLVGQGVDRAGPQRRIRDGDPVLADQGAAGDEGEAGALGDGVHEPEVDGGGIRVLAVTGRGEPVEAGIQQVARRQHLPREEVQRDAGLRPDSTADVQEEQAPGVRARGRRIVAHLDGLNGQ
jgi:hypothetical protein